MLIFYCMPVNGKIYPRFTNCGMTILKSVRYILRIIPSILLYRPTLLSQSLNQVPQINNIVCPFTDRSGRTVCQNGV